MSLALRLLLCASIAFSVACSKPEEKKDEKKEEKAKKDDDDKKKKDDDDGKKKKKDDDDKADDKAEKPAKKEPKKHDVMPARTKVPKKPDFDKEPDAKAAGNDAGCEVRQKDEWVRVSCRKANATGGKPTAVWATRGKTKDTYLYANNGVTSVVLPLLPGTDFEAKFSWTDAVYSVQVRWLDGQGKPDTVAHFLKTDDKPVTETTNGATCVCFKKVYKGEKCEDASENWAITALNPWCEMSFADDCDKLVACARGEPGAMPKCPKGTTNVFPGNSCAKECKADSGCKAGEKCLEHPNIEGKKVCGAE